MSPNRLSQSFVYPRPRFGSPTGLPGRYWWLVLVLVVPDHRSRGSDGGYSRLWHPRPAYVLRELFPDAALGLRFRSYRNTTQLFPSLACSFELPCLHSRV